LPSVSQPLFSQQIEQTDSEAADVANYLLTSDFDLQQLVNLVLKYPQNDLFICKLLTAVLSTDGLNPKIADLLADKLIKRQPQNAHFQYLKAYIQMHNKLPADFERILENIEKGNKCDLLYFPYYDYHKRILTLFEKANLNPVYFMILLQPHDYEHQRQLTTRINEQAIQSFVSGDKDYGLRILHAGSVMSQKYSDNSRNLLELLVSTSTLNSIKYTELRYARLSPNRAREVRFHLSSLKTFVDTVKEKTREDYKREVIYTLLIGTGVLSVWLTVSIFLLCAAILMVNLIQQKAKYYKVRWPAYFLLICCILFFLLLLTGIVYLTEEQVQLTTFGKQTKTNLYVPLFFIFIPIFLWVAFWLMGLLKSYRKVSYMLISIKSLFSIAFCITLAVALNITFAYDFSWRMAIGFCLFSIGISAVLWLILTYGWWLIRQIPYRWLTQNRIIQLLLIITFFAGMFAFFDIDWLKLLLSLLLVASISLVIVHPPCEKLPSLVAGLIQFFGKSEQIKTTRRKILKLLSPYLVVFYFCSLISVYFGSSLIRKKIAISLDELAAFRPLPLPNQETYNRMVDKIMTREISSRDSVGYLHLIEPNDLPGVLSLIQNADSDIIYDDDLLRAIKRSAPDVLNIFLEFLDDPNSEDVLIHRGKAGDRTVKIKLQQILKEKKSALASKENLNSETDYWDKPRLGDCFRIAGALSYISEPNESLERFLELVENSDLTQLQEGILFSGTHELYESLNSLPRKHANTVLKAYLHKTDYSDLRSGRDFSGLPEALWQYADSDIAEDLFRIMGQTSLIGKPLDIEIRGTDLASQKMMEEIFSPSDLAPEFRKAVAPYFDEDSISVLKDGLKSTDENLRAYTVWQLNKVEYEWSNKELENLVQDESWKVRANAVLAANNGRAVLMQSDKNSIVKLIAKLISAERK